MEHNTDKGEASQTAYDGEEKITVRTSADEVVQAEKEEIKPAAETSKPAKLSKLKKLKNKRVLIGATAGIALFAFGVAGYLLTNQNDAAGPTASQTEQTARLGVAVAVLDGTATYSTDGENWVALEKDTQLKEGDSLMTDASSRVVLSLDDGSAVRLNESTSVRLVSLASDDVRVLNKAGQVYSRVVESDRKYTVTIEGTDYVALGTAFNTVNSETDKGVQVLQSAVSVEGVESKVDEGKQYFKDHANADLKDKASDISVDELKSSAFMLWNLEQDEKDEAFKDKLGYLSKMKEQAPAAPAPETNGTQIKLTATTSAKGVTLKWSLSGVSAPDGFKVVRSKKNSLPTYGKDESNYLGADARSHTWGTGEGGVYYYRVCAYRPSQSTCTPYSNTVKMDTPEILPEAPVQGVVTLSLNGMVASWTDTGTAPHGWKLLVSQSQNPVYGGDNKATYYGGSPREIESLDPGTYYVRACKYTATHKLDNGCTNYSNQATLTIPSEE